MPAVVNCRHPGAVRCRAEYGRDALCSCRAPRDTPSHSPRTDILLRSLVKSSMASTLYVLFTPSSLMVMVSCVRARKTYPKFLAANTSASSSGEAA